MSSSWTTTASGRCFPDVRSPAASGTVLYQGFDSPPSSRRETIDSGSESLSSSLGAGATGLLRQAFLDADPDMVRQNTSRLTTAGRPRVIRLRPLEDLLAQPGSPVTDSYCGIFLTEPASTDVRPASHPTPPVTADFIGYQSETALPCLGLYELLPTPSNHHGGQQCEFVSQAIPMPRRK